jgi:hypothetical protein
MAWTAHISSAQLSNGVAECKLQNPTWRPNLVRHATKCFVQTQIVVREICANTCYVSKDVIAVHEQEAGLGVCTGPDTSISTFGDRELAEVPVVTHACTTPGDGSRGATAPCCARGLHTCMT